jgi:hypothetical protein
MRGRPAQQAAQTSRLPHGAVQNAQFCGNARWQIFASPIHTEPRGPPRL